MAPARTYRQPPRGRPSIGFQIEAPDAIELAPAEATLRASERRPDGRTVGELEVAVFSAALIIDRDGILEEKARDVTGGTAAVRIKLPGASGFRADAVQAATPLPYVYVFAMAPHDLGVDGGVLVTVRCATPDWPAADQMLRSLRILTRAGTAPANDTGDPDAEEPLFPIVKPTR